MIGLTPTLGGFAANVGLPPGGADGAFLPTAIGNLALWATAKDPLADGSAPTAGQIVTSWKDKSGSGFHLETPEDTPSIDLAGLNGQPSVFFDGTESLRTAGLALVSPYTILVVGRLNQASGSLARRVIGGDGNRLLGWWGDAGGSFEHSLFLTSNIHISTSPAQAATATTHGYSLVVNGTAKKFRDGSAVLSDTSGNSDTGFGNLWLGRTAFAERSACHVSEVIVYRAALSDAQIADLVGYLQRQWAGEPFDDGGFWDNFTGWA